MRLSASRMLLGRWAGTQSRAQLLAAGVAGFGLALLLIGRLVFSGFSILDDHQIIAWGDAGLWSRIASTEIVHFGTSARFRPVMFLTISLESWLFGLHPFYYRLIEILEFSCLLWAIAWVAFRTVGIFAGAALLYLMVSGRYWGNIWTHSFFAAEQIGALGLALVIFGLGSLASWFVAGSRTKVDRAMLLTGIGTLVCLGAKENFLPLVPLDFLLLVVTWRVGAISRRTLLLCGMLALLQLVTCYGILVPNLSKPTDIYGGNLTLAGRIHSIFNNVHFLMAPLLSTGAGLVVAAWATRQPERFATPDNRRLWVLAAFLVWCGIYVFWEQFFYGGQLPTGNRYDFPSQFIIAALAGSVAYGLLFIGRRWPWLNGQLTPLAIQLCFALLVLNVASFYWAHGRLLLIRQAVQISNQHTALMRADLATARATAAQHPGWPVIVATYNPMDYEAVVTLPLWLRYSGIRNPAYISVRIPENKIQTVLDKTLVSAMRGGEEHGMPSLYQAADLAVARAETSGECFIVEFHPFHTRCAVLPYRPGEYYPVD